MSLVYKSLQASSTTAQTLSLYTCAVTSTIVKSVMIHNSSASTRDVIIKLQKDGSSSQIVVFQEKAIAADGAAQALSESIVMQNGDILHAECSGADVDITLMYVENTASIVGISIKELSDWSITTPTTGQVAIYNATTGLWTPGAVNIANSEIDDLSDVSAGSPTSGDVLVWNGSLWTTSQTLQNLTDIVKEPDADSVSLEKDANNKIVVDGSTGAENISATIAGTSVITMKSASLRSNVNIGVGTNPTEKLEVSEGYIKASGTGTSHGFELERTGYDTYRIEHNDGGFTIFNETDSRKELLVKDGNVGIGTSSPSTKLEVNGGVTASGPIESSDGTNTSLTSETARFNKFGLMANRSSLYITNENASGSMQFGIGGVHAANTKMYLSSSGKVGIGTTSPSTTFEVNGPIEAGTGTVSSGGDTTTSASIVFPKGTYIKSDDGTYLRNVIGHTSGGLIDVGQYSSFVTGAKINAGTGDFQVFTGDNSERLRIDSSGNVGIGTTTPSTKLEIASSGANGIDISGDANNSSLSGRLFLSTATTGQSVALLNSGGNFTFRTQATPNNSSGTERVRIDSSGNVGIGTTSPSQKLHVVGQIYATGAIGNISTNLGQQMELGNASVTSIRFDADAWRLYAGGSGGSGEVFRVTETGNVGIGTTSPASPLHVYQDDAYTGTQSGITIEQDGVGDAVLQFLLTGARRWVVGADNNYGDRFKIASSSDLSTDDHFEMDGNGVAKFNGDQLQTSSDTEVNYGNITYTQSGTVVNGGFMNPAAEDNMVHLPHVVNDLAGFQKWGTITVSGLYKTRSGSAGSYTYSNPVTASDFDNGASFDGYSSHQGSWYSDNGADGTTVTPGVITLEWTNELRYTAFAGIVFGSTPFTATDVKIEAYRGGAWQELCDITDNSDHIVLRRIQNNSGPGAATTKLRFTLGGSNNNSYFRIHTLYAANYQAGNNNLGDYGSTVYTQGVHYLERYKNNNAHGHFNPADDNTYGLGNASQSWSYAYIDDYRVARGGTTYNRLYNDGTRFGIYYDGITNSALNILNSNGYVGIGPAATTPATQLQVDGDFRASAIQINGRALTSPSNGEYGHGSKLITQFHTSGSVTAGEVYIAGSSAWTQADANATSTSTGLIAVATDAADPAEMLVEGSVKLASNTGFSTASKGDVLYLSLTAGQLTDDISGHTTGDVVRLCGYVINASTNEVFLSPSKDWKVL